MVQVHVLYIPMLFLNNEAGACTECHGLGFITNRPGKLISNSSKSLLDGAMNGSKPGKFYGESNGQYVAILMAVGKNTELIFHCLIIVLMKKPDKLPCMDAEMRFLMWNGVINESN